MRKTSLRLDDVLTCGYRGWQARPCVDVALAVSVELDQGHEGVVLHHPLEEARGGQPPAALLSAVGRHETPGAAWSVWEA